MVAKCHVEEASASSWAHAAASSRGRQCASVAQCQEKSRASLLVARKRSSGARSERHMSAHMRQPHVLRVNR